MSTHCAPFSTKTLAAAALIALASLAHAGTAPVNAGINPNAPVNAPALKPQPATLIDLRVSVATGGTGVNTLAATAIASNGSVCGVAITSTVAFMQPVAFEMGGSYPLQHTSTFTIVNKGNQTVTAKPVAGPNFPACWGAPITVSVAIQ